MNFLVCILVGLLAGWILEFIFKSFEFKKVVGPKIANVYMYGAATGFAYLLSLLQPSFFIVVVAGLVFTSGIEYATGALYLKYRQVRLWDYSTMKYSLHGHIQLFYSILWLFLFLIFYYTILPVLI